MKKAITYIVLLLLAAALAGCVALDKPAATIFPSSNNALPPSQALQNIAPAPPAETEAQYLDLPVDKNAPESSKVKNVERVPDAVFEPDNYYQTSGIISEDENYIFINVYLIDTSSVVCVEKATGRAYMIGGTKETGYPTCGNGCVYFIQNYEGKYGILCYDPKKNTAKILFTMGMAKDLLIRDDTFYFLLISDSGDTCDLCSMKTDGSQRKRLVENVGGYGLYKGKIYYSPPNDADCRDPIYEYDPTTGNTRKITQVDNSYSFSVKINQDKIYHMALMEGQLKCQQLDLETGKIEKMPEFGTARDILGQYIIAMDEKCTLKAYDPGTGKVYDLCSIQEILDKTSHWKFGGTEKGLYLYALTDGFTLYKLVIEDGKGKLVKVTKQ